MTTQPAAKQTLSLADFPFQTYDKVRYADTDRQGHVNNAAFATFLETTTVSVIVQMNEQTRKSHPLSDKAKAFLAQPPVHLEKKV